MASSRNYSTAEVARRSGLTLRQLQYLDERHYLCPVHDGNRRQYSQEQLGKAKAIARIRRTHRMTLDRLLPLLRTTRKIRIISMPTVIRGTLVVPTTYRANAKHN